MNIAIIGSTGLVGLEIRKILEKKKINNILFVASKKSVGKEVLYNKKTHKVISIKNALSKKINYAIFSAGSEVSRKHAKEFTKKGAIVIDNSSFFRMNKNIKLIVPEINGETITKKDKIIANPNCSTIQLVLALFPLHKAYKMKRVIVSTYQSVSGTGVKAVRQMENEVNGIKGEMVYPYQIFKNALPHCDAFMNNGYTKEEMKLANEPKKILNDDSFRVTATAVRIPTAGGHSESVNVEFEKDFTLTMVRKLLNETPGVVVQDNPEVNSYPMPIFAHGKDAVFVGRIRRDESAEKTLNLWIVSDNLRKGAATNAVQIAEYLVNNVF